MNHLPFTLVAYFFNALSVLSCKFLLSKSIPDPLIYIFYISLFSLLAVILLPFTQIPTFEVFSLASLSTILWTIGTYFMYKALKIGCVSRVIPVIGTFIPLILLFIAQNSGSISSHQALGVWILILGMVFLTLSDLKGKLIFKELIFEILAAFSFAFSYLFLRQAYLEAQFFQVLVWSRIILLPCVLGIFFIPALRKKITFRKTGFNPVFLGGQASGAISEILLLFSISLANPALVNSLQGTQYVFLFIFSLFLSKKYPRIFEEKLSLPTIFPKMLGILMIGIGLYFLVREM